MNPTVRIVDGRLLHGGEQEQILVLLGRAFAKGTGPPWFKLGVPPIDHLRWKTRDAPWGATVALMEIGSRIIGYVLSMHRRILVNGSECVARDGVDLAIDPEFQGRGLHRLLAAQVERHAAQNFDLIFTYSEHPSSIRLHAERGYQQFGNPPRVLWKPGGARLHARSLLPWVRRLRWIASIPAWSISTVRSFDERLDAFCSAAAAPFALVHRRTASSLNWRYCDPRGGAFTVRLAEQEGQVLGYLVSAVRGEEGHIADVLALPGRLDVVRSLVGDALRMLDEAGAVRTSCRMPAVHPYNVVLRLYGFLLTPERTGAVWSPRRLNANALSFLHDPRAPVHVTTGDSDHV